MATERPSLVFLGYEIDGDGHAYQRLALGDETALLYPVLDPISFEHALEVERTILPAIVALYEQAPEHAAFDAFRAFFERFRRIQRGDGSALEELDELAARVLEAVRASINDLTPEHEIPGRAFARFYQHAICESPQYREKARSSLAALVARLGGTLGPD